MRLINPRVLNFSPSDTSLRAHFKNTTKTKPIIGYITLMIDQSSTDVPHIAAPSFTTQTLNDGYGHDTAVILPAVINEQGTVIPAATLSNYTHITEGIN